MSFKMLELGRSADLLLDSREPKYSMSVTDVEKKLSEMERGSYKERKTMELGNKCNFISCQYNQAGICQNEDARKECVEVARRVLCLEENDADSSKTG